jgi:hypothetical protein
MFIHQSAVGRVELPIHRNSASAGATANMTKIL